MGYRRAHKAFAQKISRDFPTEAATCSGSVAVTQLVPVIAGSGTRAYKGVGGSFTLTTTLDEVDKVSAARPCDGTGAFLSQAIVISGPGTVIFQRRAGPRTSSPSAARDAAIPVTGSARIRALSAIVRVPENRGTGELPNSGLIQDAADGRYPAPPPPSLP